jgi:hypothetical protein
MQQIIMWQMRRSWDYVIMTTAQAIIISDRGAIFVTESKKNDLGMSWGPAGTFHIKNLQRSILSLSKFISIDCRHCAPARTRFGDFAQHGGATPTSFWVFDTLMTSKNKEGGFACSCLHLIRMGLNDIFIESWPLARHKRVIHLLRHSRWLCWFHLNLLLNESIVAGRGSITAMLQGWINIPQKVFKGTSIKKQFVNKATLEGRMSLSKYSHTNPDYFSQKDMILFRVQLIYI